MPFPARLTLLAGLLGALAACSGTSKPPPEIIGGGPGSRLAVTTLEGPDSLAVVAGFYDLERSEPCGARLASDGTWRCLPPGVNSVGDGNVFADPTCAESSRLVTRHNRFAGSKLAVMPDPASCPTRWQVRELGAQVTGFPTTYTRANPGDPCVELSMRYVDRYLLADEVAPASFAAFTERLGALHDGLRARDLVAADGAWQESGAWDEGRGLRCSWLRDVDGSWRCIDSDQAGWFGRMSDPACSVPAVGYLGGQVGCTPSIAVGDSEHGCGGWSGIYEVGAAAPVVYVSTNLSSGPVCSAVQDPSASVAAPFWSRGVELSPSAFPGGVEVASGSGRLTGVTVDSGGGPRLAGELIDHALGIRCEAGYIVNENVLRCLPTEASLATVLENYFSDDLCSRRVAWPTGCEAAVALFRSGAVMVGDIQYETYDFYNRLGAPYPGTIYSWGATGCAAATGPLPEGSPHLIGAYLPYSAIAPLTYQLRTQ